MALGCLSIVREQAEPVFLALSLSLFLSLCNAAPGCDRSGSEAIAGVLPRLENMREVQTEFHV